MSISWIHQEITWSNTNPIPLLFTFNFCFHRKLNFCHSCKFLTSSPMPLEYITQDSDKRNSLCLLFHFERYFLNFLIMRNKEIFKKNNAKIKSILISGSTILYTCNISASAKKRQNMFSEEEIFYSVLVFLWIVYFWESYLSSRQVTIVYS